MKWFHSFLLLAAIGIFTGCQSGDKWGRKDGVFEDGKKYRLRPVSSTVNYPDANLEYRFMSDGVMGFHVSNYQLGMQTPDAGDLMCANSNQGQHIHLIFDNEPYTAHYQQQFAMNKPDGRYTMLAFLGKSYHVGIKNPNAFVLHNVSIRDNNIYARSSPKDPMVFYSRPKGTYVGKDAENVILDFYLANCKLKGQAYKVLADINGEQHIIDEWQPYYIDGLPYGESTIKLTLIFNSGEMVPSKLNPVQRTITLKEDPI